MIASNLPMTTVFAAAKKQQVKQETKKLEEQSRKMQQEIKDLDEKMIKSNDAYVLSFYMKMEIWHIWKSFLKQIIFRSS